MTDFNTYENQSVNHVQRRQALILPSRRKHVVFAGLTVILLALAPILYTHFSGSAKDALSFGVVSVDPVIADTEIQAPLAPLDDETLSSPDLLEGDIAKGTNPTTALAGNSQTIGQIRVDALGNPIQGQVQGQVQGQTQAALPTTNTPRQNPSSGNFGANKPKTILIDGQAIGPSSLAPAPFAGLTKTNQFGRVPTKSPNGQTALNSYNRPFTANADKKPVSIILGGLGVNRAITQQAIDRLPADITLSFAAHAVGLQDWVNRARADGHEVMIEIPMESAGFSPTEPGADKTLLTTNAPADNLRHMDWLLSRAQGYFGIINYNGDQFLTRADAAAPVLGRLSESGLGLITDGAFLAPTLGALSQSVNLPYKNSFGLIDPAQDTTLIRGQLNSLSGLARSGGAPIGVGFAYPETIDVLAAWTSQLSASGLELAPASHTLIK